LFTIESGILQILKHKLCSVCQSNHKMIAVNDSSDSSSEDSDVKDERDRIHQNPSIKKDSAILLDGVKKYYGNFLAVNQLSIAINHGECFGLLGVNGAGKTTTFKMMAGDSEISAGDIYLNAYDIKTEIKKARKSIGYCPQFDALIPDLTVRETLSLFARLRGIPEKSIKDIVSNVISSVGIQQHRDKKTQALSGGNKRKLSTGMAIIGNPPIIFLDEPTTGMDPSARRHLWDVLTQMRLNGQTIILTSHSMEECEALCSQIAIMVNGKFKCLGSLQHLKSKFNKGYTLLAKVGGTDDSIQTNTERVKTFIEETFPGSISNDSHRGYIDYQINSERTSWASIFGTLERAKSDFNLLDYSVSQTTLEQVFISFAKTQIEPREQGNRRWCGMGCCRKN